MISKIQLGATGCIDDYLDELFAKNNYNRYKQYRLDDIELSFRPLYEIEKYCGSGIKDMYTGLTKSMERSIRENRKLRTKWVECRKHEGSGRTYVLILDDTYAWDSRVFANPLAKQTLPKDFL